ncbi:hypothetical protein ES703_44711 [subsurface metagenome]
MRRDSAVRRHNAANRDSLVFTFGNLRIPIGLQHSLGIGPHHCIKNPPAFDLDDKCDITTFLQERVASGDGNLTNNKITKQSG